MDLGLSLVFRDETRNLFTQPSENGDIDSINLMEYLGDNTFQQAISTAGEAVDEAIGLVLSRSSGDSLAGAVQRLDTMLSRVKDVKQYENYQRVWLRAKMLGETYERQACLIDAKRPKAIPTTDVFGANSSIISNYLLGLKRAGYWENSVYRSIVENSISALGGKYSYTGIDGDMPARIARLYIYNGAMNECWMGLQTTRTWPYSMTGTLGLNASNLDPIWNLRKGGTFGADTTGGTTNADATAQDGYKVICTFATDETLVKRVLINASSAGSKWLFGRYQVLLRARCTSTLSVRVRLGSGFTWSGNTNMNMLYQQRIDASSGWKLYSLGEVDVPAASLYSQAGSSGKFNVGFEIDAAKISGSGNLELDCLVFIPTLDGYIHVKTNTAQADSYGYHVYQSPEGIMKGRLCTTDQDYVREDFVPDAVDFGMRPSAGTFVFAAQSPTGNVTTDALNLGIWAYERWVTLRGAEGATA